MSFPALMPLLGALLPPQRLTVAPAAWPGCGWHCRDETVPAGRSLLGLRLRARGLWGEGEGLYVLTSELPCSSFQGRQGCVGSWPWVHTEVAMLSKAQQTPCHGAGDKKVQARKGENAWRLWPGEEQVIPYFISSTSFHYCRQLAQCPGSSQGLGTRSLHTQQTPVSLGSWAAAGEAALCAAK